MIPQVAHLKNGDVCLHLTWSKEKLLKWKETEIICQKDVWKSSLWRIKESIYEAVCYLQLKQSL